MNYEAPPTAPSQKPTNDVLRILVIFAAGGCLFLALIGGLGYWMVSKAMKEGPKPAPELGKFEVVH